MEPTHPGHLARRRLLSAVWTYGFWWQGLVVRRKIYMWTETEDAPKPIRTRIGSQAQISQLPTCRSDIVGKHHAEAHPQRAQLLDFKGLVWRVADGAEFQAWHNCSCPATMAKKYTKCVWARFAGKWDCATGPGMSGDPNERKGAESSSETCFHTAQLLQSRPQRCS